MPSETFGQQAIVNDLKGLYLPPPSSHKGQNGKLLIIGGSRLFHAASLWAAEIASKIVDLVFYSSIPLNLKLMTELKIKGMFRNGIIVPRGEIENYLLEADCVLIGPGMVRQNKKQEFDIKIKNIKEIEKIADEGKQTKMLVCYLLKKYPKKRWVIDGGALQEMEKEWIPKEAILTPHHGEFKMLFDKEATYEIVKQTAKKYQCVILKKGGEDIVCSPFECKTIAGGNSGMTKGGTGDVLAGLAASFYAKNSAFLSALAASFINKTAGERLFKKVGFYFNASDLLSEIPKVLKEFK